MAAVVYAAPSLEHIARAVQALGAENPGALPGAVAAIRTAVDHLASHPLLGRRVEGDIRELVISYGQTGYVALYRFVVPSDYVLILALRHQRELGFVP